MASLGVHTKDLNTFMHKCMSNLSLFYGQFVLLHLTGGFEPLYSDGHPPGSHNG